MFARLGNFNFNGCIVDWPVPIMCMLLHSWQATIYLPEGWNDAISK